MSERVRERIEQWRKRAESGRPERVCADRFAGKVAFVTGGAGGSGRAICHRLAAEGASVAVADREGETAKRVAGQLERGIGLEVDVTDPGQVGRSVAAAGEQLGPIDVLIMSAGGGLIEKKPFWEHSDDDWDLVVDVNLKGQWIVARAVAPAMIERGVGKIVSVSSNGAFVGVPGLAAYVAAKAGVNALVMTMARELGPHGINVNAVAPGYVWVEHPKAVYRGDQAEMDASAERSLAAQPLARVGLPTDIANVATFLASADADHVTGQILMANGGGVMR